MILVEEYQSDFQEGKLRLDLKPKYTLHYYEGFYDNAHFEIVDGDGVYPTIQWLDDTSKFEPLTETEDKIIKQFIKNL